MTLPCEVRSGDGKGQQQPIAAADAQGRALEASSLNYTMIGREKAGGGLVQSGGNVDVWGALAHTGNGMFRGFQNQ
ncbi:MAG TPA: hypothetical protein VFE63_09975 [Roseiarcus sp.]|nr:hypothetical protein [Roseiarcus sp.]